MSEALTQDVLKLLTAGGSRPIIKKKAALCLLRLIRKTPVDSQLVVADTFQPVLSKLLEEQDLGVLLSAVALLTGIAARQGVDGYETCQTRVIRILDRLVTATNITIDYTYYGIPSPWLQAKCLRVLQYYPLPDSAGMQRGLHDILASIIATSAEVAKQANTNKANAQHAILFEAITLAIHLDMDRDLLLSSVSILGKYLSIREPNIKYLALEYLARLALIPEIIDEIRAQLAVIIASLRDPDVSIRRRATDLLFTVCDPTSAGIGSSQHDQQENS